MTRIAVLADIHGNADALAAVLADIETQGITRMVNLGDCFSGPLAPAETWDMLAARPMPTVRGNHDRFLIEQTPERMGRSDLAAHEDLPGAALEWLRGLPPVLEMDDLFLCHAVPGDDLTYWLDRVTPEGHVALRGAGEVAELAGGVTRPVILCGHTHVPRLVRLASGQMVLNPGSVGCPAYSDTLPVPHRVEMASPEARYAILDPAPGGYAVSFRALPYDPARMAARARARGREDWAQAVLTGRVG
ncbi:metallophosphoesterase family protein [Frigidibacter sp. ROC022]|uniref:metallophosphoesterase family protein n=1 Tax=Frigidibacter sp. ROC022 TaxID=2971796 RepID=UPI00215AC67C|nr:metallophosphatase family protein [Frigidibacter sp. ROC022]MCR8726623.1 metallophosphatase family protein [Frigidibacter sp. ROC022]